MVKKKLVKLEVEEDEFVSEEEKDPEDIYDEDKREDMVEDDEITAAEEGFMRGWDGDVEGGKKGKKVNAHIDSLSGELVKEQYNED